MFTQVNATTGGPNKRQVYQYLRTPGTTSSIGRDSGPQVFPVYETLNEQRDPLMSQKVQNDGDPEPQQQVQHFITFINTLKHSTFYILKK